MRFDETSLEQATAYHEYFLRTRDIRLRDLAWAMRESPELQLMDGSYDSLVPLWTWANTHADAGLPSVPDGGGPPSSSFLDAGPSHLDGYNVLGENIERYVLESVLDRTPGARWEIATRAYEEDWMHHRTALRLPNGKVFGLSGLGRGLWVHHAHGVAVRADSLFLTVTGGYHDGTVPTGTSILAPLLDEPPLPWDDPARVPPRASGFASAETAGVVANDSVRSTRGESELIFAAIGADVEELERAKPLDESAVAAVLAGLGFAGEELELGLRSSETQLLHPSSAILVEAFAHRDRLRGLHFELHGPEQENLAVVAAFTSLGHRLRARLGSEDDWASGL